MLPKKQINNITDTTDYGIEYFRSHRAEIEWRTLRPSRKLHPINVCGSPPRPIFAAGLFAAFDKVYNAVDKSIAVRPGFFSEHFGMEMAAYFMNLNSDHPHLVAQQPWRVCRDETGVFIQSENGIGLARNLSAGRWHIFYAARASQLQPSNLALEIMSSINYALDKEVAFRRPSLLFPELCNEPAVLRAAWGVFINTVFSPTSRKGEVCGRRSERNRFLFIDRLHEARRDKDACANVIASLAAIPQLMLLRGWCGGTPFHDSCEYNITQLIEWMLEYQHDSTSFHLKNEQQIRDKLLTVQDNDGFTPLHRAALSKNRNLCERLLSAGASPTIVDRYGYSALYYLEEFAAWV